MRAILWQGTTDASAIVREILRGLFTLAGIEFVVVDTEEELLAAAAQARRAGDHDILVIDCFHGTPDDMDRCATIVTQTQLSVHIVHPREEAVRTLEELAGRQLTWLPSVVTIEVLVDKLHMLRVLASTTAPVALRPLLTSRERDVAPLLADGRTNAEIATALHMTDETVKTHVHAIHPAKVRRRNTARVRSEIQNEWMRREGGYSEARVRGGISPAAGEKRTQNSPATGDRLSPFLHEMMKAPRS